MIDLCKEIARMGRGIGNENRYRIIETLMKGSQTVGDIAGKYQIHHKQVQDWKKRLLENAELVFERRVKEEEEVDRREGELLKKVGQLSMENDWLKKKLEKLSLGTEDS